MEAETQANAGKAVLFIIILFSVSTKLSIFLIYLSKNILVIPCNIAILLNIHTGFFSKRLIAYQPLTKVTNN